LPSFSDDGISIIEKKNNANFLALFFVLFLSAGEKQL
jgi:hypothetical protein